MEKERRLYSVLESYHILYDGFRTMKYYIKGMREGELSPDFIERIMLAVTEVNDCPACSFVHTKKALETGMDNEEIQGMLSGTFDSIPPKQLPAVMFAQHYAESKGNPSKAAWQEVVTQYGSSRALGILATVRTIMMGNVYGIVLGSFVNRFKGKSDSRSSLFYEISIMVSALVFMPFLLIHLLITFLFKKPVISFK